jgi:hypothetical protein
MSREEKTEERRVRGEDRNAVTERKRERDSEGREEEAHKVRASSQRRGRLMGR